MQRLLGARGTQFFPKTRSDVELALSRKKYQNQKVSKTKDLDMVKTFLLRAVGLQKFKNCAGITLFVCRNRYNSYDSVGFVPGGSIFGTLCTTQDETISNGYCDSQHQFARKYSKAGNSILEGFFSTNLEKVQKDVECTFGVLKKRWKVLNHGSKHPEMEQCKKIFIACCILHNFLLNQMVLNSVRVGHGYSIGDDRLWLDGNTVNVDKNAFERFLFTQFEMRRSLLANYLHVF